LSYIKVDDMNFIERIFETVRNAFSDLAEVISCKIREWQARCEIAKGKKRYIGHLTGSEIQYEPEEPDKELALRVVSYLQKRFPNGIESKIQEISIDERKDLICQIVEEVEQIFEVEPVNFEILYPTTAEEFYAYGCGFYNRSENLLCLNGAYLMDEHIELVEEQIYTIFHELKHARQYAAIAHERDYGYSEDILEAWKYNVVVYIRPNENDEAYRKQALERDAFGFENYVREIFETNH